MIEAYAFAAAFAAQIVAASVLYPARLIKYVRGWARDFGSERFAQLYPGADYSRWVERFATRYRALNIVIAIIGVWLLGRMLSDMPRSEWAGDAKSLAGFYFLLQMSPIILLALYAVIYYKLFTSQESRRTATLQRRGLYDFVSPFAVSVAVLSYLLFVALSVYIDLYVHDNPSGSKTLYSLIGCITALYALNAFTIYKSVYGKNNPLVTYEGRVHSIGLTVKSCIYGSIAAVWFFLIVVTLAQLDLREWEPFALSMFLAITSSTLLMTMTPPRSRKPYADERESTQVS